MFGIRSLLGCWLLSIALPSTGVATPPPEQVSAVQSVLDGISHNYSLIKSFHARIVEDIHPEFSYFAEGADVDEAANVDEGAEVDEDYTEGAEIGGGIFEDATVRYEVWVSGADERFEDPDRSYLIKRNQTVTEYSAIGSRADIFHIDEAQQAGRVDPRDPRNTGFVRGGARIQDVLRSTNVKSVEILERFGRPVIVIEANVPDEEDLAIFIEFDSAYNFLPTRTYYRRQDGEIECKTDIEYEQVVSDPEPAWFLRKAVQRFAGPVQVKSVDATEWGQVVTISVEDLDVNQRIPDDVFIAPPFPDGTVVYGDVKATASTVGMPAVSLSDGEPSNYRFWMIVSSVVFVLVIMSFIVYRRRLRVMH
ncbi:MAG: hypothetical protein RJP95_01910 [Pirellulales bacterium]